VDISFVDSDDRLRYFSSGDRIFARAKTVLGRKVDFCHPPRSVGTVKKIIEAFKEGKRDFAEFWLRINERFIYIKYIPIRSREGKYLGTLEIIQDITDLRKLDGEKRLLDWK